jgi:small subunit ribosomal protein S9
MSATSTYFEGIGRRKTATARVRMTPASKQSIVINDQDLATYFKTEDLQKKAIESMAQSIVKDQKFEITVKVTGSGTSSQSEAVRHGIARALEKFDGTLRSELKKAGFLTRDQRAKERRKFGLKKARKAKQWSKR